MIVDLDYQQLGEWELSTQVSNKDDITNYVNSQVKYSFYNCEVKDNVCQLKNRVINYLSNDSIISTTSIVVPEKENGKVRDFIVVVDNLSDTIKLPFVDKSGIKLTWYVDENTSVVDLNYDPTTKSIYSISEIRENTFIITKKVLVQVFK